MKNLRIARRAAAGGPSGMTAEHLRQLLECDREVAVFHQFAIMARGEVPDRIEEAIRLGRTTALRKPDGGVRGIVVGDFLRRLIARTIAKQIAKLVEVATAPWQYALTTRAGRECVAHVLQHLTDGDAQATILSVNGIGAFDLVSRNAMLQGLMSIEDGGKVLPFVRTFYGQPYNFIWEDERSDVHDNSPGGGRRARGPTHAPALLSGTTRCVESCGRSDGGRWTLVRFSGRFVHPSVTLIELVRFTPSSNGSCFATPTSASTWARLRYGTEVATSQRHAHDCKRLLQWWTSQLWSGEGITPSQSPPQESKSSGLQWATRVTSVLSCR